MSALRRQKLNVKTKQNVIREISPKLHALVLGAIFVGSFCGVIVEKKKSKKNVFSH